jgi:GMP synthase (glutamine-hydrolysing)
MERMARILVVEHEPSCPPGTLADAATDAGVLLELLRPGEGERLPADLDGWDGLAVLGGEMGVGDADAWPHLTATMALLRAAHRQRLPALGICLGGQLAAQALGGRVYRDPRGLEIGWIGLELTPQGRADPVVGALAGAVRVFSWHRDSFDPPPGATLLARGAPDRHQAFRLGSVVGLQFHPEVDERIVTGWYAAAAGQGSTPAYPLGEALAGAASHVPAARRVLDAFCLAAARGAATKP